MPTSRGFYRVEISNQIGDRNIGSRKLLHVAPVSLDKGNRSVFAELFDHQLASLTNRRVWIVVYLTILDCRHVLVQQTDEIAKDSTLCLTPESQQNEVVFGQQ